MSDQSSNYQVVAHSAYVPSRMSAPEAAESAPSVDFNYVFRVIRRRLALISLFVAISVAFAAAFVLLDFPLYSSSTRIIIEQPKIDVLGADAITSDAALNPAEADGQIQIIRSDQIIADMLETGGFLSKPAFLNPEASGKPQQLRAAVTSWLSQVPWLAGLIPAAEDTPSQALDMAAAVALVRDRLDVRRIGLSYVFEVSASWTDPVIAAEIADGMAAAYIENRQTLRSGKTEETTAWLNERLATLREGADAAEAAVVAYRIENNIIEAGREGLLNEQQLSALSTQLNNAVADTRAKREQLSRFRLIAQQDILTAPLGDDANEQNLRDMRDELIDLEAQRANSAQLVGADNAATLDILQRIVRLNQAIGAETQRTLTVIEQSYAAAVAKEQEIRTSLQQITAESAIISGAQVKLQALQSEAQVHRTLYDNYLQLYMQTVQQQTFPTTDARVISPAVIAENDNTDGVRIAIIALAVGASLGLVAALFFERMDRSVRTGWQLRAATGVQTIGLLPAPISAAHSRHNRLGQGKQPVNLGSNQFRVVGTAYGAVLSDALSPYTEAMRRIKVAVDAVAPNTKIPILGFISVDNIACRSTVAANYAELLAMGGQRTLLVDLDMRGANLSAALTPKAPAGLANFMAPGKTDDIQSIFWTDQSTGLDFLPARGIHGWAAANGMSPDPARMMRTMAKLAVHYDYIVLDCAPLSTSADAAELAHMVSGFILVSEWGKTSSDAVAKYTSESGIPFQKLLGSVIGDVNVARYARYESV